MKMKRVLALMLSSAMICTAVPGQVFAAEETLEVVNEFSDESDEDDFVEVEDRKLEESNADEKVPDTDEEISEIDLQEDNQQDLDIESGNDEDEIFSDSVANENSRKIIASGEENKTITWILYDDGELVISGSGDIPDYLINDVSIGKTSAPWNVYKENIKVISVEEGIKRIGNSAFLGCNVIKAKVADSVEDIGNNVFERCFGLQEIQLPSKMISIGMHTFYRCRSLNKIKIPEGITTISGALFGDCRALTSIEIPEGVTSINELAFVECWNLTNVKLPESLLEIKNSVFSDCYKLKDINIPKSVLSIGESAFNYCESLEQIELPERITNIENLTFSDCKNLTNIKIPNNVIQLGIGAFNNCRNLAKIEIPESMKYIVLHAFAGCDNIKYCIFDGTKFQWDKVKKNDSGLENIKIYYKKEIHEHDYEENILKSATCIEMGERELICSICGDSKTEEIPATGHVWDSGNVIREATCEELGIKTYICTVCEATQTEDIPALGHVWNDGIITKEPTCIETGEKTYTCTVCGKIKREEIPAVGHIEIKDEAVDPTCEEPGLTEGSHCSVCGVVIKKQEEIPATGHKEVTDEAVEPTCEIPGKTEGIHCENCGKVLKEQEEIPATGHRYSLGYTIKEPTCIETGEKTYTCTVCGKIKREEIPAVGHIEIKDEAVDPTCEEPGLTEGSHCSVCGVVIKKQEEIPALGHKFTKKKVVSQATVFRAARQEYECTTCGFKEIRNVGNKLKATIKVSTSKIIMKPQQKVTSLKVTFTKGDSVTSWKTSNSKVVKVAGKSKGTCTLTAGKIGGTATLTIKLKSGLSKKVSVIVNVKTQKITGISSKITLVKGQYITIKPKLYPATSTDKITFKSNNNTVSVNSSGKIYARKKGTAVITVKSGNKTVKSQITVEDPKISKTAISLNIGKKYNLKVTGTKQKVTWSSSNKAVATVSSNGIVTAKKGGSAKITAKIGNKKYICNLKVKFIITDKQITYAALGWLTLDEDSLYYHKKKAKLRKICIDSNNEIWYYYDAYILPCWARARIVPDNNILVGSCYHSSIPSGKALELTSYVWDYKPNVKFVQTISLSKVAIKKAELKKAQDYTISGY